MKKLLFLLLAICCSVVLYARREVKIRNLWTIPQVHVLFGNFRVSFAIRDINRTLVLLRAHGDSTYVTDCGLDTARDYTYVLQPGFRQQYRDAMQPLLQNMVATYLLSEGRAVVENEKGEVMKMVLADINYVGAIVSIDFSDPETNQILFSGKMSKAILAVDMGMED